MIESEQLAWGSHLPALLACIGCTKGPVLELGVGHFSTPALHALCGAMGRTLVSIEQNQEWYDKFKHLWSGFHGLHQRQSYDEYCRYCVCDDLVSVAFIDNSPGGIGRSVPFELLLPKCEYVVVHDYHLENETHIQPILAETGARFHVTRTYQPPTLVASLKLDIPESLRRL